MKENCSALQINKYLSKYEAIKRSCADLHIKNNINSRLSHVAKRLLPYKSVVYTQALYQVARMTVMR
jgi:hypothetical protein